MKIISLYYNLELHKESAELSNLSLSELKQYFVRKIITSDIYKNNASKKYYCNIVNSKKSIEELIEYMNSIISNRNRYKIEE